MANELKGLLKHSAVYFAGIIISRLAGFVLIPLYTRYLRPADYGLLELLVLTADVVALVAGLQVSSAIARFYHAADNEAEKRATISTTIIIAFVAASIAYLLLFTWAGRYSSLVLGQEGHGNLLQIMLGAALLNVVVQVPLTYIRILEKSRLFVGITLVQLLATVVLNLVFIVYLDWSVFGVVLGSMIVAGSLFVALVLWTLRSTGVVWEPNLARSIVGYSAPLVPAAIGMFIINFSDRFLLGKLADMAQVGLYALGYKFGFLLSALIAQPFHLAWEGRVMKFYRSPSRSDLLNRSLLGMTVLLLVAAVGLSLLIKEALWLLTTPQYYGAAVIVPIVAAAYVVSGLTRVVISPLYAEKQTRTIGRIHLIGAFISLLANFVLISVYGMIGAAFAILATFLYIFVAITIASTRVSEVQWQWAKVMRVIIIALAVAILGRAVDTGSLWLDVAVKSTILIVMVPLLYTIAFPRDSEQSIVRRLWAALGGRNAAASLPQEAAHAKDAQTVK